MKYTVVKEFIDKHTKVFNPVGSVIELTDERATEILSAGKYIKAEKTDETKAPALDKMKVDELKALAAEKGIDLGEAKTKAEIIAVIEANQ